MLAATAVARPDRHLPRPQARLAVSRSLEKRDARRHLSRQGFALAPRRDPRRFGSAKLPIGTPAPAAIARANDSLRLFAHTFGGAFLFVTVFLA